MSENTDGQDFVKDVISALVDFPDEVEVERNLDEKGVLLTVSANPNDIGRIIGKQGQTAQSLRIILRALGVKHNAYYSLKINDPRRSRDSENEQATTERDPV